MTDKTNPYGVADTGHVWDDNLRELTNPPPKWWTIGLHASWIFVLVYGILYPTWPLIHSHTKGLLGWTSIGEYKQDLNAIQKVRAKYENQLKQTPLKAIVANHDLTQYTVRSAKVLFGDNCAACHGAGGQGNPGYPVLADDDWLYGGSLQTIDQTITEGRHAMMPSHVNSLSQQEIDDLAKYVKNVSEGKSYAPGQKLFMGKGGCFACHGPNAKGNPALGSANLTDKIWRFGHGSLADIKYTITHGVNDPNDPKSRNAVMPSWKDRLTKTEIKKLAVYVHQLGGGQ